MKKLLLVFLLVIGCGDPSKNSADPIAPCTKRNERCLNPTNLVFKGTNGLHSVGNVGDIKAVSINLIVNGTYHSKDFVEQGAINVSKQFGFAFPKEHTEQIANLEITGFITVTFISIERKLEIREFTIENGNIIRDKIYPEVIYKPSTTLNVDWLNHQ